MFETAIAEWQTPRGAPAAFECQQDRADWGVIESTLVGDEHGPGALSLSGWALDIGTYIARRSPFWRLAARGIVCRPPDPCLPAIAWCVYSGRCRSATRRGGQRDG
jgi:hypothetical protein